MRGTTSLTASSTLPDPLGTWDLIEFRYKNLFRVEYADGILS